MGKAQTMQKPITNEQKELVQTSWQKVVPIADTAAMSFYDRLFEIDRSTLEVAIAGATQKANADDWRRGKRPRPGRCDFGSSCRTGTKAWRLRRYRQHYDSVGAALLWTFEKGLGEQFTPEVMDAWATVYGLLANSIKSPVAAVLRVRNEMNG